jgi:hypothetical protein
VPRAEAEAAREEARAASLEAERLRRLVGNMVPRAEMEASTPSLVLCFFRVHSTKQERAEAMIP